MSDITIYPTTYDVGEGKRHSERNMSHVFSSLTMQTDHVVEGLQVSATEYPSVEMAPGVAIISGYVVTVRGAMGIEAVSNGLGYVHLVLRRDGLGKVVGIDLVASEADALEDGLLLASTLDDIGLGTTDVTDRRPVGWAVARAGGEMTGELTAPAVRVRKLIGGQVRGWRVTPGSDDQALQIELSSPDVGAFPVARVRYNAVLDEGSIEIRDLDTGLWQAVAHAGESGWAHLDGPLKQVYQVSDTAISVTSTEWVGLWAIRMPRGGVYEMRVTLATTDQVMLRLTASGGSEEWSTSAVESTHATPFIIPGDELVLSARIPEGGGAVSVNPPSLHCAGFRLNQPYMSWRADAPGMMGGLSDG